MVNSVSVNFLAHFSPFFLYSDILVYVVWTGDDKNGKAFQSSNFRYSAFPEQNIKDRITDSLPDFPDVPGFLGGGDSNNGA